MSQADARPALPPARPLTRGRQWRLIALAAIGLVALLLGAALVRRLTPPAATPAPDAPAGSFRPTAQQMAQLKVATVGIGDDPGGIAATGIIAVDGEHSTPVVLPYSGQVATVLAEAGQRVARGQPLLRIASSDFVDARNALFAATAQRATAAAQLHLAEETARRQAAIYATAGGAQKDARQADSDRITARSGLRSADAALGAARDKLALLGNTPDEVRRLEAAGGAAGIYSLTTYHAPVAGTIATRDVAPGQYVSAGGDKPVMTITDLSSVWLVAQVDEGDAARVHVGDPVKVTTPAYPGRVFAARIDNVGAALDPVTHRLPVRATVANPDEALKPEMFARFAIARPGVASAIVVPADAVIHEGDGARVWVVEPGGVLRSRAVTVADSADGRETIASGLRPGERIVVAGAIFVNEAGLGE